MRRLISLIAVIPAAVSGQAGAQGITTHEVRENIYMLEGRGGNIGVSVGDDGVLIIDDQFEDLARPIRDAIGKLSDGELKFILNTHHHGDHTGGNEALGQETPIIAHQNVRKRLEQGKDLSDARVRNGLPVITYDDGLSLHFNGEEIRVVHYPAGHTDNDSVIFFTGSNVVHMGDHFFNGRFPFVDLASGGAVESYLANVQSIIDTIPDDIGIIPGHGALATKDDLKQWVTMLRESIDIIKRGIDGGATMQTLVDEGLPSKFDEMGTGFVSTKRWISTVYEGLTGTRD